MSKAWPDLPRSIRINGESWRVRYLRVGRIKFRDSQDAYGYTDNSIYEIAVAVGPPSRPFPLRRVLKYLFHEMCHAAIVAFKLEERLCDKFGAGLVEELDRAGLLCQMARAGKPKRARRE